MATASVITPTIPRPAGESAARLWERHRRWLVYLTFTVYWLVILEGVLRRWVFPGLGRYIFFIRDPFVILIYLLSIKARIWPRKSFFLTFGVLFSLASLILIVVQARLVEIPFSWLLAGFGWRMYFFYLPLPFVMAKFFRREDFTRLVRQTLLFAIPVSLLVLAQYRSPASDILNTGSGTAEDDRYGSLNSTSGSAVRTTGTFTSALGESYFVCSLVAMLMGTWLVRPSRRAIRGLPLLLSTAATLVCLLLSGSRGVLLESCIILVINGVSLLFIGRRELFIRLLVMLAVLAPLSFWTIKLVLPDSIENIRYHFENAGASDEQGFGQFGILSRALFGFYGWVYLVPQTPAEGFGLGIATNAAPALTNGSRKMHGASQFFAVWLPTTEQRYAAETGLGRQIIDLGPAFGLLYIVFRLGLAVWIGALAFRAASRARDITPVAVFSFIAYPMAFDLLTGNGTVYAYIWLFAGFALAACQFTASTPMFYRPVVRVFPRRQLRPLAPHSPAIAANLPG